MRVSFAFAAAALFVACSDDVAREEHPSPDGMVRLIWEEREGGGAAGYSDLQLYIEVEGSPEVFPVATIKRTGGTFFVRWIDSREVEVCQPGLSEYWTDRIAVSTERGEFDIRINAACEGMRVVSVATRVEEYRRQRRGD